MRRLRTLRSRLALSFAVAVVAAGLPYALTASATFYLHERAEEEARALAARTAPGLASSACLPLTKALPHDDSGEIREFLARLALHMALSMPVVAAAAAGVGLWLAGRAVAPLREAAQLARGARSNSNHLLLPELGPEEWDTLARAVNELVRDQRRAMERARAFSANAAHELRTPLTAMLGEVQVALRRERSPQEYREVLHRLEGEVTQLAALVSALLTLARADAGVLHVELIAFDLAAVAAEAAAAVRARQGGSGAEIRLLTEPSPARGDALLARRVIDNLLDNALRHGGRKVELKVARERSSATASVSDDGPGLAPAIRTRLFERFNREPGASEGFGLGLAIAQALASAQGGQLRLDEEAAQTRFVLELPSAPEP